MDSQCTLLLASPVCSAHPSFQIIFLLKLSVDPNLRISSLGSMAIILLTPSEFTIHSPDRITIEGASELRILAEHFEVTLSGKPTDSVSRWILAHAQRIPESGEEFALDGLRLTVVRATPRRIQEVLVWRTPRGDRQTNPDYTH